MTSPKIGDTFTTPNGGGGGTGPCSVRYTPNTWNNGFTADVTITNTGTATISGWTLTFTFTGNQRITSAWNATVTQNGQSVTAVPVDHNRTMAPSGTANFGFQGTYSGTNANPTSFTLNGNACTAG